MEKKNEAISPKVLSEEKFNDRIHRMGITWGIFIPLVFMLAPLIVTMYFGLNLDVGLVLRITAPLAIMFGINGAADRAVMAPIMGAGANYLATTTGNIENAKLPAVLNAISLLGYEEGSEKSRMVAIIAVAVSGLVSVAILIVAMGFLAPIIAPVLSNPVLKPAFSNLFCALLPPMLMPFLMKDPKQGIIPFGLGLVIFLIAGITFFSDNSSYIMLVVMVATVLITYLIYKRKQKSNKSTNNTISAD